MANKPRRDENFMHQDAGEIEVGYFRKRQSQFDEEIGRGIKGNKPKVNKPVRRQQKRG